MACLSLFSSNQEAVNGRQSTMKIDLHLHTLYGSACAYMDPDQLINQAKSVGLDGVCITEHNQIWEQKAIENLQKKHDFLVIGGVEVSTDLGEILAFGLHEPVLEIYYAGDLRKMVDEAGGYMVMAHPFRSEPDLFSTYSSSGGEVLSQNIRELSARPVFGLVDAMEVFNGRAGFKETAFTEAAAAYLNLAGTGGSDAHAILGVGACYTWFEEPIANEQDLIDQLKKGRFFGVDDRWKKESRVTF
ncbi:MAG: PHP domain-containing protein [Thermodesulfobacteriota bacterium]